MEEEKINCEGHQGKCKFCGKEGGWQRTIGKMKQVSRQGKPIVDPCCKPCANNLVYVKKRYSITASEKFGYKIPRPNHLR